MKQSVNTCIIPAAGKGSRWAPVSGYLPKEMLPLVDKPVIEWVTEEVIASGATKIIIVINKQKKIIKDYFSKNKKLNKRVSIHYVYQDQPLGIAHAVYLSKNIIEGKPFSMVMADMPSISKTPALKQVIKGYTQTKSDHAVSLDKFPPDRMHLYGECLLRSRKDKYLDVGHFCPKDKEPQTPHHPGNKFRMSGRFVFSNMIFPIIESLLKVKSTGEINDRDTLQLALRQKHSVVGVRISGHTYDTGTPVGYVHANTTFFKRKIARQ